MTPPRNVRRRQALADAAIEVLGTRGIHQLTHRAVDEAAGLPEGTASNYFNSRDELLEAVARRIVDLQNADMGAPVTSADAAGESGAAGEQQLAQLIGNALYDGATRQRTRFLAMFELVLEATRRPALLEALSGLTAASLAATAKQHRALGLRTSPEQVQALISLFGGALFALVTAPQAAVSQDVAAALARCVVGGVLTELAGPPG